MSEELQNREAPTSEQDFTQGRISVPFDFNFSINVTLDPATSETLERIAKALESAGTVVPRGPKGMDEKSTIADPVEEFRATIMPRPDWIEVPGAKNATYYEKDGRLYVRYQSCTELETSWSEIDWLSNMGEEEYKEATHKMFPNAYQRQFTGLNRMVQAYRKGMIPGHAPKMCTLKDLFVDEKPVEFEQKTAKKEQKSTKKPKFPQKHPVPGYLNLEYLERDGCLHIWYAGSTVKTTREKIEEVSKKGLKEAEELITEIVGETAGKNKRTAIRQFVKAFDAGAVKPSRVIVPEEELERNFASFQAEEDGILVGDI